MKNFEREEQIKRFVEYWKDKGYEKGESQTFWLSFLRDVLSVEKPENIISFEEPIKGEHTNFIDGWIQNTKVLIEQKSFNVNLKSAIKQADGSLLTPYQQALKYNNGRTFDKKARWIITCNFREFFIYDMNKTNCEPESILLKDLTKEYYRFEFLIKKDNVDIRKEMEVSFRAGEIVGQIYEALSKKYHNIETDKHEQQSLNMLCVRLVFCLYAEDSGIFEHNQFYDYMRSFKAENARTALKELFKMLDTKEEERDKYVDQKLLAFPYVNGGLFSDENIVIPQLDEEILARLLLSASCGFDWKDISPTIFGAVFESTLNLSTRRSGGMHYTSIENIHKVIDPLFFNDLKKEFEDIKNITVSRTKKIALMKFRKKLGTLIFFDPACGSGNFLTETYISIRRLENEALALECGIQIEMGFEEDNPVQVSIKQFYGIEINDFAVNVAKTALWISEFKMLKETMTIIHNPIDFLPLKSYDNIIEGNALCMNWETIVPKDKLNYIIGNPPFVGARLMSLGQKNDVLQVFGKDWENIGNLDYVACWYKKSVDLMENTQIKTALVSTNSICQGESVAILWKPLFKKGIHIDFAYKSFRWDSESSIKAHVHCVIVGFSFCNCGKKILFDGDRFEFVKNINAYLLNADNICIESRSSALCNVPKIGIGNKPIDGGNYLFTQQEMDEFIKSEPKSKKFFRPWLGADEFINNHFRYCLWLGDCSFSDLANMPKCLERVEKVKSFRLASKSEGTRKIATKPTRFHVENMPKGQFIVVPETTSDGRRYIPIGFLDSEMIVSNLMFLIPDATLYHFGVLTSNVHMAWMRTVCGRLGMGYRYSKDIVYNNFPWCNPTEEQKQKIEQTARGVLDARALYPDWSLANLYDEKSMPLELRRAHQLNDRAVMEAYGFWGKLNTESECVAELMNMYKTLTLS